LKIDQIEFISSSPSLKFCPENDLPEFAFIGRSNVGKSSLINMLAGRKSIAKVSGTPGKTRLINHFLVTSALSGHKTANWYLVDLPGYGFAKLSRTEKEKFEGMIKNYLQKRENLAITFLLIDSRLAPQKIDMDFIRWLGDNEIAFVILFTKTDKPTKKVLAENLAVYKTELMKEWSELPNIIQTSASKTAGREAVLETIGSALLEIS
jgi:GTP-binding protein